MTGQIVGLLRQLNQSLEHEGREQMKRLDISPSQGLILHYLLSQKGRTVFSAELHRQFCMSKSALSTALKGLKQRGYLVMTTVPGDDRKKGIMLTDRAQEAEKQIREGLDLQQERLCRNIPEPRLKVLEGILHDMIRNMNTQESGRNDT